MIPASLLVMTPATDGMSIVSARIDQNYYFIAQFKTTQEANDFIQRALKISTGAYWFKFILGVDMLGAAILFRDPDVTISSMTGLALRRTTPPIWAIVLGRWFLNRLQKDHCELAIVHDIMRAKGAIKLLGTK